MAAVFAAIAVGLLVLFYFIPPNPARQPVFVVIVALLVALAFGFIGGDVAVRLSLPFLRDHPVSGSAAGGIGAFVLAFLLCKSLFPKPTVAVGDPPKKEYEGPFLLRLRPRPVHTEASVVDFRRGQHAEYVALQPAPQEYVIHELELPKSGTRYEAVYRPVVPDSRLVDRQHLAADLLETATRVCLVPGKPRNLAQEHYASLECAWGQTCDLDQTDPGWVTPCPQNSGFWERLVPSAYANSAPAAHWLGASLKTLTKRKLDLADDPPFMALDARGELVEPDGPLSAAKFFTAEVRVNSVPLFIDGWRPDEIVAAVDFSSGLSFDFGLQNLGFAGTDGGFENLEVQFTWLDGSKRPLGSSLLSRKIVAFRDIAGAEVVAGGVKFRWGGLYQPSSRLDRFSVMVASPNSLQEAEFLREKIDATRQEAPTPSGAKEGIVAVLRPPLVPWRLQQYENRSYSLLLGLRRTSGQIAFSFDAEEADRLCRFVYTQRAGFNSGIHETVLRYEWPPASGRTDGGRNRYRLCRDL